MIVTDLIGRQYGLLPCTEDDIPNHFKRVEHWIEPDFKDAYVDRMKQCVEAGTAYKLDDDSCYLYFLKTKKSFAEAVCINGYGKPMSVIALISGIFRKIHRDIFFVEFVMHKGKVMAEYKFMLSPKSMRKFQHQDDVLLVNLQHMLKVWSKLVVKRRDSDG